MSEVEENQGGINKSEDALCNSRLANMPVPIFAMIMGLAGLTIVYLKAGSSLWNSLLPGEILAGITAGLFLVLALGYAGKLLRYPGKVFAEFHSPVRLQFFPTISISLLLLSIVFLHLQPLVSFVLWCAGTGAHLLFTLVILSIWMQKDKFEINHIEPSWFIPVVGNILVPVAGVAHAPVEISWFFFSIGLIFWLMLFTIFLYRIVFHQPIAQKRLPTFFILIAPPAVGFISYLRLSGGLDNFSRILYFFALFLLLLLLFQWRMFRQMKFFISWWAYSFPLAALTIATLTMRAQVPAEDAGWLTVLAWGLTGMVSLVVAALLILTARAALRHEVCTCEP